jgi:hypothetical protein
MSHPTAADRVAQAALKLVIHSDRGVIVVRGVQATGRVSRL